MPGRHRSNLKYVVAIPQNIESALYQHLFKNKVEQGAFIFARPIESSTELRIEAVDVYLIPPSGWQAQLDVYLEMTDAERAKIMKIARDRNLAVIDCHSHPGSKDNVWFSPSDRRGIREFATYVKWKLDGKPFTAMVWGESSVDAVIWHGDFKDAQTVDEICITGSTPISITPRNTWSRLIPPFYFGNRYGV
ncbi:MAG: hypothetical protein HY515_01425 [Candidatus Aenigmarchaeota archaeon]|nr:hypothetical protein [Candidatus Aenigmarchaeota archaeon]